MLLAPLQRRKFERMHASDDPFAYAGKRFELDRLDRMIGLLGGKVFENALEVGCAEGALTERLAVLCRKVTAMDISEGALVKARTRVGPGVRVDWVQGNLMDWDPAARGPFDLVVVSEVLYYLGERNTLMRLTGAGGRVLEGALARMAGALTPGGRLLLAHSFAGSELRARRVAYREALERLGLVLLREEEVPPTGEEGTDECLLSLLERPGEAQRP